MNREKTWEFEINMDDQDLIRFIDVGAMGGLGPSLAAHASELWPVLFEPNAVEAQALERGMVHYPRYTVIAGALGDADASVDLVKTRNPTCYSVLPPNFPFLNEYGISYHFAVEGREPVALSRYDTLYRAGRVPLPDALKIDVQGFEYQVLVGFGELLSDVLAIKLETQFYEVYQQQKLFGDLVQYLAKFGFVLRKIDCDKMEHFAGDLVEVDAYFSKDRRSIRRLPPRARQKYEVLAKAWALPAYNFELP